MCDLGTREGDVCWRDGCQGVIEVREVENCSCHINPPCAACTSPREYCPECGWDASEEPVARDYAITCDLNTGAWYAPLKECPLDPRKIDWHNRSHTHFTMLKEGVCPEGTTREEVEALVKGTFGGRFEKWTGTAFRYIAYTD